MKQAQSQTRGALDRRALICLVLGLLVLAVGIAAALSHSAQRRTGTNGVWPQLAAGELAAGQRACQDGELLPAGTAQAQFVVQPLQAVGPRVTVTLSRQGRALARASALVAARNGTTLRVPLRPLTQDVDDVTVCLTATARGRVALVGGPTPPGTGSLTIAGQQTGASLSIGYMAAGASSWWRHASTVVDRMALGRGDWGGRWLVWLAGLLLLTSLVLVGGVLVRGVIAQAPEASDEAADAAASASGEGSWRARLRRVPALAWAIAAVAVCNAAAWSILTPAFQVPDEQTHVAYAQQIAETGRPPIARRGDEQLAPELLGAMARTRFGTLDARTYGAAVWSPLQQRLLDAELHAGLAHRSPNNTAGPAAPEPPTYYALEAIPYRVAGGATLLDRIALMRLLSALMAGVTALFVFLFVRECLPGRPWAWTVGALGAALSPVLGFVSGGVNPDALLFPICAALFYALAVAFRRGLTTHRAAWIGGILALGLIGKINFYGLAPGALLALALAARTSAGGLNMRAARLVGIAVVIAVAPFLLLTMLDALAWDRAFVLAHTPAERPEDHGNLGGQLSYLWQVFLPRLPGQSTAFPEFYPGYQLWLKGFVGKFGWTVVGFAEWAYRLGALLLGAVVVLAGSVLIRERAALRQRRWEFLGYAAMTGGLLLLIGMVALRGFAPGIAGAVQGRYLLPLLALFAALLALAARGAGARWGRTVGVALVLVCVGWSLFGQLLTIAWFYG
ncbi:MAG TPA: DUF2142 domain-containing protein [Conexibacter sp.]|nr:DUF2142 domain-containing protein [Conexibacter sp.]